MNDTVEHAAQHEGHLVLTRTLNAPAQRVWDAFTRPEHLAQWWGAKEVTTEVLALDLRPGGVFHYLQRTPDGQEMYGKFTYHEVEAPTRLVYTSAFADPEGQTIRAPFSAEWPLEILNTLILEARGNQTLLTLRGFPHGATPAEEATFVGARPMLEGGFAGTFERLEAHLALT